MTSAIGQAWVEQLAQWPDFQQKSNALQMKHIIIA